MPNNEFQVLIQAIVDAKDTQTQLNAIKNLSVKIEKLNLDQSAITELRNQLNKNGIDVNLVLRNTSQIQNQAKQTGQQIGQLLSDSAGEAISGVSSKNIGKYFKINPSTSKDFENQMKSLVSQWTNTKGKMIDVKIDTRTVYDKDSDASFERLHQATVTYKNDLDEIIKKTIAWRQIGTTTDSKGNKVAIRGFVEVAGQYSKSLDQANAKTDTFIDKQKRAVAQLQNSLSSMQSNYLDKNVSKPIKSQGNIDSLNNQYKTVEQAIANLGSANKNTFTDMQIEAQKQISILQNMIKEYRNVENVSSKLKGTDLASGLSIAQNDLEKFKNDSKDFPQIIKTIQELDKALSQVGDVASLNKFTDQLRVARSELAKIKSETSASNRNEKTGINVSGLTSKISDIQRISPQINEFKTQINGAEVSIQSLLDDISKINTQSDFSVVNTKFKAFTDSAKAAGIAITEIATNSNKLQDIQSLFGNATTQVDQLTAKFKNLGFTEDEIRQKMQSVITAYGQLQAAISTGNSKSVDDANKQFNRSLSETSNLYKQIKTDATLYYNTTKQTKLSNDIQNWMSKNTAATKQAKASLTAFINELSNGRVNVARLDEIQAKFQQIDNQMRSLGRLGKSFRQTFSESIKKFSYWTSSTFLVMKTIQEIKQAVKSVKDLDTALVDLKKTSTMTESQLNEFYYSANNVAKQMGVTTKQIIEQSAAWSRLGYSSSKSATQMAKYSSMFASISPGMDIDRSTDGLVSVMKAFKIETDDVLDGIMSKINIIGNNKALSNSDIIEFLTRSSSAMAEANNSLEDTIALGTAAVEITRDAASVGQVLKTSSMRIRGRRTLPPYRVIYMLCS